MTNKIVILERSVELYEHYIDDERWERTLSFPRGGLTYLISNGTIKFYAYIDYLYRNCLMSMQLPIYIVDEKRGIDGEYSDVDEIIEILDPIFPSNDIDAELEYYLTKREAELTYQPIGDYVTTDELDEVLDDYYTKDEADARFQPIGDYVSADTFDVYTAQTSDILDGKLDITAYTPTDLSNYYTKQEVYNKNETYNRNEIDDKIAEAGGFDPTKYYTKTVCDNRFAFKSDIPSLDGYATEDWVLSKKYATASSVQQYITNLQQQINSIVEAVSGCCSQTGETIYRWITLTGPNDFICSGTTKYEKQQKQQSTDNGMTWTNVVPAEYQKGAVLETDSEDCGYVPDPQYRWKAAPASDYMCSGTSKYYKEYYEVSYDEGETWEHVVPEQTRRGSLIEAESTDCGYIPPQYRWYTSQSEYICSGTTKYEKQYYQVSYDNGSTWENVSPLQTRTGSVIEYNSEDCGYVPPMPQYRWKDTPSKTCSGYNKYYVAVRQVSYDEGATWENVTPIETQLGSLYQAYSYSCGYVGTPKLKLYTDNGDMNQLNCESSTSSTLTCAEYWDVYDNFNGDACSGLHIEVGDCVNTIGDLLYGRLINFSPCAKTIDYGKNVTKVKDGNGFADNCSGLTAVTLPPNITKINFTFRGCTSLRTMTVPSKVTEIGSGVWQNCSSLESLTFLSITPPDLGENYAATFQNTNNCILYVPAASLNAYKTANGWREYASRIMAINS